MTRRLPDVEGDEVRVLLRGPMPATRSGELCDDLTRLVGAGTVRSVVCAVAAPVDLGVVHVLARLRLLSRRHGVRLVVRPTGRAAAELADLLALTGLTDPVGRPPLPGRC